MLILSVFAGTITGEGLMKLKITSVYKFSEYDKKMILRDILPERTSDDELIRRLDSLERLVAGLQIPDNSRMISRIDAQDIVMNDIRRKIDTLAASIKDIDLPDINRIMSRMDAQDIVLSDIRKKVDVLTEAMKDNRTSAVAQDTSRQSETTGSSYASQPVTSGETEIREIEDSWSDIMSYIKDGSYRSRYKLGNYKKLSFGSEGVIRMQIVAFDAEPLAYGDGKAAITWISLDPLKTKHSMNPKYIRKKTGTGGLGGWKCSEARAYLRTAIKPLLPVTVRDNIKLVKKYSFSFDINGESIRNEETIDELWIPSSGELVSPRETESKALRYETYVWQKPDPSTPGKAYLSRTADSVYGFRHCFIGTVQDILFTTPLYVNVGFCT